MSRPAAVRAAVVESPSGSVAPPEVEFDAGVAASPDFEDASAVAEITIPEVPWWYGLRREAMLVGALTVVGLGVWAYSSGRTTSDASPITGTLVVSSHPTAASVIVDGRVAGLTPLAIDVPVGEHEVAVQDGDRVESARTFGVAIVAGEQVARHVELASAAAPVAAPATTGGLSIESDPTGASVMVDGAAQGSTPVTLGRLRPGRYLIELRTNTGSAERQVLVTAGATSSVYFSMPNAGNLPLAGWLVLPDSPALEVYENGRLIGTTAQSRIVVTAGRHELTLVNDALGIRVQQAVDVAAGSHVAVRLDSLE